MAAPRRKKGDKKAARKPSYLDFDNSKYSWKRNVDYRKNPEQYKVGKGEQGVLIVQPYKDEILPLWRFRTPDIASRSAKEIFDKFLNYLKHDDFVGADMARKFLQMGFTRSRRYANYSGGKKYDKEHDYEQFEKGTGDPSKAKSAEIFYEFWQNAEGNPEYSASKQKWKQQHG